MMYSGSIVCGALPFRRLVGIVSRRYSIGTADAAELVRDFRSMREFRGVRSEAAFVAFLKRLEDSGGAS